jgi:antitoxin VapB
MKKAKLFLNGRSQAVRLPKEYRFESDEVYVKKIDNLILLIPKDDPWATLIDSLDKFSDDYMEKREQPEIQNRS